MSYDAIPPMVSSFPKNRDVTRGFALRRIAESKHTVTHAGHYMSVEARWTTRATAPGFHDATQFARRRPRASSIARASASTPTALRPSRAAATSVVPLPQKQSSTAPPGGETLLDAEPTIFNRTSHRFENRPTIFGQALTSATLKSWLCIPGSAPPSRWC